MDILDNIADMLTSLGFNREFNYDGHVVFKRYKDEIHDEVSISRYTVHWYRYKTENIVYKKGYYSPDDFIIKFNKVYNTSLRLLKIKKIRNVIKCN